MNEIKQKLNREFDLLMPKIDLAEVKKQPIIFLKIDKKVKLNTRKLLFNKLRFMAAVLALALFSGVLVKALTPMPSKITCIILDISPSVQIVLEDNNIVMVNPLDIDAENFVRDKNIDVIGLTAEEGVLDILTAARAGGYLSKTDNNLSVMAINNSGQLAIKYLNAVNETINKFARIENYQLDVVSEVIDYKDYNDIVFNGKNMVDNLDQDKLEVIKAGE